MNMLNAAEEKELKDFLGKKKILMIEDHYSTIKGHIKVLNKFLGEERIDVSSTLSDAFDKFKHHIDDYSFIFIDLNLPRPTNLDSELANLLERLRPSGMNEGQALGLWLDDNKADKKYMYFSVVPSVKEEYMQDYPKQLEIKVMDKACGIDNFLTILYQQCKLAFSSTAKN